MTDTQFNLLLDTLNQTSGKPGLGKNTQNEFREEVVKVIARTDEKELQERIKREADNSSVMAKALEKTAEPLKWVADKIKGAFETVTGFIGGIFNFLPFGGLLKGAAVIGGMILGWKKLQPFLEKPEVKEWFKDFGQKVRNMVNKIIVWFAKTFTNADPGEDFDIVNWTRGKIDGILQGRSVGEYLVDLLADIVAKVVSWVTGEDYSADDIKQIMRDTFDKLKGKFMDVFHNVKDAIMNVVDVVRSVIDTVNEIRTNVSETVLALKREAAYQAAKAKKNTLLRGEGAQIKKLSTRLAGESRGGVSLDNIKTRDVDEAEGLLQAIYGDTLTKDEKSLRYLQSRMDEDFTAHPLFADFSHAQREDLKKTIDLIIDKKKAAKSQRNEVTQRVHNPKAIAAMSSSVNTLVGDNFRKLGGYDSKGDISTHGRELLSLSSQISKAGNLASKTGSGISDQEVTKIASIVSKVNGETLNNRSELNAILSELKKFNSGQEKMIKTQKHKAHKTGG